MNVYQRKLAVMRTIGGIAPDAVHPHHKFKYISYQHLMNTLRPACIEHGLDITADVVDGHAIVTYTNVEEPTDRIVQQFGPDGLPDDKAASYVVKYALMKALLIGDGEDPDSGDLQPRRAVGGRNLSTPAAKPEAPPETPAAGSEGHGTPDQERIIAWAALNPDHWALVKQKAQLGDKISVRAIRALPEAKVREALSVIDELAAVPA